MTSRSCQYRLASQEEERDKEKLGLNFPSPSISHHGLLLPVPSPFPAPLLPTRTDCPFSWIRKNWPQSVQHVFTPNTTR